MTRAPRESDPALRRVQRDSAVLAVAAAVLALALQRGRPEGALGVLAGAGLMGFSYAAIKGGVTALLARAAGQDRGGPAARLSGATRAWLAVRFFGRYLAVGLAAWAALVPLKAHPLGLFAGVTVPVLAIGIEALRLARRTPRRGRGSRR